MRLLRSSLNRLIRKTGYRLQRIPAVNGSYVDLRDVSDDPIAAACVANGKKFLIRARLDNCRALSFKAYPCTQGSQHPFIKLLLEYPETPSRMPSHSALSLFYEGFKPKNAAERLGLEPPYCYGALMTLAADSVPEPWLPITPSQSAAALRRWTVAESKRGGLGQCFDVSGNTSYGPLSLEKLELEHARLFHIRDSIRNSGFRSHESQQFVSAQMCHDGRQPAFFIENGQHRIAALAALGYTEIALLVSRVIRCYEAPFWPNVRSGVFSIDQARFVTERMMSGTSF